MFCKKMLSHWFERDHWIVQESEDGWGFENKKKKYGMETVLRSFDGFGTQKNSGNCLHNVPVARELFQLSILSLFLVEIAERS